jgi:hypothetical protein
MAAAITVTAAQVGLVDPIKARVKSFIAAATITKGQAVYITTAGKVNLADGDGSGTLQCIGIALNGAGAGQAVDVCMEGELYGFDLSAVAYGGPVYVHTTAGALYDATQTGTILIGRCVPMSDSPTLTKVLMVHAAWNTIWA